ncbi:MAG TPA: hypothetical protein DDZ81_25870 [Acetobacteraceae bacterium]|jgi:hypothetical protein|nr:hypothetical protein [Acetobacteraceae bacterium]
MTDPQRQADRPKWSTPTPRIIVLAAIFGLTWAGGALAFPLIDPTGDGGVPNGTELAAPDARDLQHQLQIVNGLGGAGGSQAWTFTPRFDFQQMLTDNVLQQNSPRVWDTVSYFAPGFSLLGNTPRAIVNFTYTPTLSLYARESSLNALTQQFNGTATITAVPDLLFVDLRTVAGVVNTYGGLGGMGGVGATQAATPQSTIPMLAGNAQGLNRNNESQFASAGITPYILRQFGDWGTLRVGDSVDVSRSDTLSGFAASPFPTGGINGQTLITNEQNAHFVTGDILEFFQNAVDADIQNSQTTADAGSIKGVTGQPIAGSFQSSMHRVVFSDTITYLANRYVSLFVSGGHEDIVYTGFYSLPIHDLTWSLGTTITPNPDSQLTLSYGHQNGFNSASVNGHYALTARTVLTASYGSSLGTQLQNLQNQLGLASSTANGALVNGQTGGRLFSSINALPVQAGLFRTDMLDVGLQTARDRDIFTFDFALSKQSTQMAGPSATGQADTFTTTWVHQMRPDMTVNAFFSYSIQNQSGVVGPNWGDGTSIAASLAWQWQLSDTLGASLRYSYFERQSNAAVFTFYQNMIILGVSKTF